MVNGRDQDAATEVGSHFKAQSVRMLYIPLLLAHA
jgi:hypothetical protein